MKNAHCGYCGARFEPDLRIPVDEVRLYDVLSAPEGMVLIFGIVAPRSSRDLPAFAPNSETSEFVVMQEAAELTFPLHTQVAARYWSSRAGPSE